MSGTLIAALKTDSSLHITTREEDGTMRTRLYEPVPESETVLEPSDLKSWSRVVRQCGGLARIGGRVARDA